VTEEDHATYAVIGAGLQDRPVPADDRLEEVLGDTPSRTSREAFEVWRVSPGAD
jgi:hypothetical protein